MKIMFDNEQVLFYHFQKFLNFLCLLLIVDVFRIWTYILYHSNIMKLDSCLVLILK